MNNYPHNKDNFSTSDIFLASYLRLVGCQLLSVDRRNQRRIKFIFAQDAEEKVIEYFNGAEVSAVRFASAIGECRNLIYDVG